MAKSVLLSRSWGLTLIDARRIAALLGLGGVRFVAANRSSVRAPRPVRQRDSRGARFCAGERR